MKVRRILETAIYCDDLARTAAFYQTLLEATPMLSGDRLVALDAGDGTDLLLFQRGNSGALVTSGAVWMPRPNGRPLPPLSYR